MASLADLQSAYANATKAGATDDAAVLAAEIQRLQTPAPTASAPGFWSTMASTTGDALNALGTGVVQGATRLAGVPADTLANVVDLGKAAVGSGFLAAGKVPPDILQVGDRKDVPLSGDNLITKLHDTSVGPSLLDARNPDYQGGYLQNIGSALPGAAIGANGLVNAAKQVIVPTLGAVAAKGAYDLTGSQDAAIAASLVPMAARAGMRGPSVPALPTPKNNALLAGQAEGYVVPPSQAGAGWVNARLESMAGKAALKQEATQRNQAVTNALAARSVGLAPDEPITLDALQQLRATAGQNGYAPLDRVPAINSTLSYQNALDALDQRFGQPTSGIQALVNPDVSTLVADLNRPQFTGAEVNSLVKNLREGGNNKVSGSYGAANGDQSRNLGKAMVGGSNALEDLVHENLQGTPDAALIPALKDARAKIAKTYTVQNALNAATGDVNAGALSRAFNKGKPLSPEQTVIGQFASAFPQVTGKGASTPTAGVSAVEPMAMGAAGLAGEAMMGHAGLAAGLLPLLRDPIRHALLSKWYQEHFAHAPDLPGPRIGVAPEAAAAQAGAGLGSGLYQP